MRLKIVNCIFETMWLKCMIMCFNVLGGFCWYIYFLIVPQAISSDKCLWFSFWPLSLKDLRIHFIEKYCISFLHVFYFLCILFSIHHCYINVFLKTFMYFFMDILYSMFIPTRFVLCNKLTEILIVSHGFSIHGNQVSFNMDKLN